MINTHTTNKNGTEIVLTTDDKNDGVFDWTAGRGYLIAQITSTTPAQAVNTFEILCIRHHDELLALERALWNTPPSAARMKPSNALEKLIKRLCKEAGVVDS